MHQSSEVFAQTDIVGGLIANRKLRQTPKNDLVQMNFTGDAQIGTLRTCCWKLLKNMRIEFA